jgi:hypothetical protein
MNVLFVHCFSITSHVSLRSRRSSLVAIGALNKNRTQINTHIYTHKHTHIHTYIDSSAYMVSVAYVRLFEVRGLVGVSVVTRC